MSTQNERELARDRLVDAIGGNAFDCTRVWSAWGVGTMSEDDFVPIINDDNRLDEILDHVCAPLLSRIAELQSRIDALSKDAERYHKVKRFMHVDPACIEDDYGGASPGLCMDGERLCDSTYIEAWGKQSEMIDAAIDKLPTVDAAISAREGE